MTRPAVHLRGPAVAVFPRDANPYQALLYGAMAQRGFSVSYVGEATASRTASLALLPLELVVRRMLGCRILHLHWVFGFRVPLGGRLALARRGARRWFGFVLWVANRIGMRVVWTAHNALPHEPVFDDDVAARRTLVRSSDLVVVHSPATLAALGDLDARPQRSAVVPHGPFEVPATAQLRAPRADDGALRVLFFGRIHEYKGVEDLLVAARAVSAPLRLTVAGVCPDPELHRRITELAADCGHPVELRLRHVAEEDVPALMGEADVVALPFRAVTTSGSALLAMGYGRPVVVPDLEAFAHVPRDAVALYDGAVASLAACLDDVASWPAQRLQEVGLRAADHARETGWPEVAERLEAEFNRLLAGAAS